MSADPIIAPQDPGLRKAELAIAYLLRYGVILCAIVILIGWILAVLGYGSSAHDFNLALSGAHEVDVVFPHSTGEFIQLIQALDSRTWIELGLFLLILLPISRVFLAMLIFAAERNWKFVAFSFLVLAVLVASMINGKAG